MDESVVWFYVDPFTLHLNRGRDLNMDREEWVTCPFSGLETVSGGVYQLYFNGFQVSSFGRRHGQYEWFLHNIGPALGPSPGSTHSQCDYTMKPIRSQSPTAESLTNLKTVLFKTIVSYRILCSLRAAQLFAVYVKTRTVRTSC